MVSGGELGRGGNPRGELDNPMTPAKDPKQASKAAAAAASAAAAEAAGKKLGKSCFSWFFQ